MSTTEKTRLTDRDVVVNLLRRIGPRTITDLRDDASMAQWPETRVERAVIQAWADSRVTIDVEDRLVAL